MPVDPTNYTHCIRKGTDSLVPGAIQYYDLDVTQA
jgi:hypothetical protein